MSCTIKAIIGLGNPGHKFEYTRHNIGFRVVNALAEQHGGSWQSQQNAEKCTISLGDKTILLIKPQTFMNNSGQVMPSLKKQGIAAENILAVHDELEKPFGSVAIKQGGSARGHNGLRSLIEHIGPDFYRLRIGISRPEHKENVPHYVLENFSQTHEEIENCIQNAVILLENFIQKPE